MVDVNATDLKKCSYVLTVILDPNFMPSECLKVPKDRKAVVIFRS